MGWIIPCLPATRLHPTLTNISSNGNVLKEVTGADGARMWAKLKIYMFLTWPQPEMQKIASITWPLFSPAMMRSGWLPALSETHKILWKCHENWDTWQRTGPASLVAQSCHLCWCCCKAYWAQIQGQAEPHQIPIVFCFQNTFSPAEGKGRRTQLSHCL